eukprot:CAMPEP_0197240338 /NCGR_PEP_ID=MMETSP1429-20130617/6648_1 /TAXON_ID=49237 /ORGANISM="Chaetoceros  sp., Strain UNC1202" /LENGTH=118 /DNA_ID=CAMNT_0042699959 /DNA_START=121 /DNA_END=477 /DNA_ORIENTATION=+
MPKTTEKTKIVTNYKNLEQEFEVESIVIDAKSQASRTDEKLGTELHDPLNVDMPSIVDLPRSFFVKMQEQKARENGEILLDIEMAIGRAAIFIGVWLLAQEFITGSSLLEQFQMIGSV